jgi:hypothetical protein
MTGSTNKWSHVLHSNWRTPSSAGRREALAGVIEAWQMKHRGRTTALSTEWKLDMVWTPQGWISSSRTGIGRGSFGPGPGMVSKIEIEPECTFSTRFETN